MVALGEIMVLGETMRDHAITPAVIVRDINPRINRRPNPLRALIPLAIPTLPVIPIPPEVTVGDLR